MPHARTVAVHNPAEFAGNRYNALQHYNVLLLEAGAACGPFAPGLNAVVVPVPLFARTQLHALLEKARENTALLGAHPGLGKMDLSGIDRAGGTPSQYLDAVVAMRAGQAPLTAGELDDLLNLLTYSANESEGKILEAAVASSAAGLGLPADVLVVIPFDGSYLAGDAPGNLPQTWWGAFLGFWVALGTWAWQVLCAIGGFFWGLLVGFLALFGITLVGPIDLEHIGAIEGVVKCLVLVFYFIGLALLILDYVILILLVGATLAFFSLIMGGELILTLSKVKYSSESLSFEMSYSITPYHSSLLDIDAPQVHFEIKLHEMPVFSSDWRLDWPFLFIGQNGFDELQGGGEANVPLQGTKLGGMTDSPNSIIGMKDKPNAPSPSTASGERYVLITLPWGSQAVGPSLDTDATHYTDADADGIPDKYQNFILYPNRYGLPLPDAQPGDSDGDGLLDADEAYWDSVQGKWITGGGRYSTNPNLPDSDFDGLSDGWEVQMYNDGVKDKDGKIVVPPGEIHPDSPDLFVELDYVAGTKPWSTLTANILRGIFIALGIICGYLVHGDLSP